MAPYYDGPTTFGIELEAIAVYPVGTFDKGGDWSDVITELSRRCNAKGIRSTGHETLEDDEPINFSDDNYSTWTFGNEDGLHLSDGELAALGAKVNGLGDGEEDYDIVALEVASRMLHFSDPNWQHEVATVLSIFDELRDDFGVRFITNSTTGFHIHVGFGAGRRGYVGIPLRTVKGVLELCTGFEDRLDALYSINRINENCAIPGAHFNAGLAWHFQHNKLTDFGPNVFHWLTSIEEASSFEQLGSFFRNDIPSEDLLNTYRTNAHFCTLNVDNLYEAPHHGDGPPTGTIEFRQHGGTLNTAAIIGHVLLKQALLFKQISNPKFRLLDLLTAIGGCKALLEYHEHRRSFSVEQAKAAEYNNAVVALKSGKLTGLVALEAQAFVEDYQRSNWAAVSSRITSKTHAGAYGKQQTRLDFDITGEWNNFVWFNSGVIKSEELATMARVMVFQQLNGDDIEFDVDMSDCDSSV